MKFDPFCLQLAVLSINWSAHFQRIATPSTSKKDQALFRSTHWKSDLFWWARCESCDVVLNMALDQCRCHSNLYIAVHTQIDHWSTSQMGANSIPWDSSELYILTYSRFMSPLYMRMLVKWVFRGKTAQHCWSKIIHERTLKQTTTRF